ncbi:tetratricopeptide repeat protein [Streptomyces sp. NK15101]|uniref:tetratricopeptide repeat protein n=1 Tax=Streptomyces sp. NK15101 TaxID=2873261 RepID=UPI001CECCBC7|nr:tetratricopeptide repeat protein [Streptomyces sp. NK15101]
MDATARRVRRHLARARRNETEGRYAQAEGDLRAALRQARAAPGSGSVSAEAAEAASALGILLEALGRPAEAEEILLFAVRLHERVHGPDDSRLAPSLNALGAVRQRRGDLAGAERLYARVVGITTRAAARSARRTPPPDGPTCPRARTGFPCLCGWRDGGAVRRGPGAHSFG